jgi:hypothetical protein
MGSSIPDDEGFDDLPDAEPIADEPNDKPFDDEPFDAGVEADPESDPEKYIQQLSGKLGQELRKYTEELGAPDYDLEKFAINSVLSATNSGEMDQQDQADIIQKVKSSTTDGTGKKNDEPEEADVEGGEEDLPSDEPLDLDNIDMEESVLGKKSTDDLLNKKVYVTNRKEVGIVKKQNGNDIVVQMPQNGEMINMTLADVKEVTETHNPNGNTKTVFQDEFLGVEDEGMEENKYTSLAKKIKEMVEENLNEFEVMTVAGKPYWTGKELKKNSIPTVEPKVEPKVEPTPKRETRRSKPWRIIPEDLPNPNPKAEKSEIQFIDSTEFSEDGNVITITFDVDGIRFNTNFMNTGEEVGNRQEYDEPLVYIYQTDIQDNGKQYQVFVNRTGHEENPDAPYLDPQPEIEEV